MEKTMETVVWQTKWLGVFQGQDLPGLSINYVTLTRIWQNYHQSCIKDENLFWSGLQWHRSCHGNEMTSLLISLEAIIIIIMIKNNIYIVPILFSTFSAGWAVLPNRSRELFWASSEIFIILHITRKPNSVIVLLSIQSIYKLLASLRLSSKLWHISRHGFTSRSFPLFILLVYVWRILAFLRFIS